MMNQDKGLRDAERIGTFQSIEVAAREKIGKVQLHNGHIEAEEMERWIQDYTRSKERPLSYPTGTALRRDISAGKARTVAYDRP